MLPASLHLENYYTHLERCLLTTHVFDAAVGREVRFCCSVPCINVLV